MKDGRSIAIIGARGIGNYGGFETFVKEIAPMLSERNIDVYCTCELDGKNVGQNYKGAGLLYFPISPPINYTARKVFEFIYDNYFLFSTSSKSNRIILLGTLGAPSVVFQRLLGKKVYVNIDGMEWRRDKFSWIEKMILKMSFHVCLLFANKVVVDSRQLINEIPDGMRWKTAYIAYGVDSQPAILPNAAIRKVLDGHGISENEYWLVIARLEPENNISMIIDAFKKTTSKKKLVVVGNFTNEEFAKKVKENLDARTIFLGHIYDPELLTYLRQNCFAYIHGHSVGGTNPSLLEAMSSSLVIAAHDNRFNREVLDGNGLFFDSAEMLSAAILDVEDDPEKFRDMAIKAKERVMKVYSWEAIADSYDDMIKD